MTTEIIPINLAMPLNLAQVHCYLLRTESGFFLIDTGLPISRHKLENELNRVGCHDSNLKLIILTHGDFDHTGNAIYLHQRFGAHIAMHAGDIGMLENGDMFSNRKVKKATIKWLVQLLIRFKDENRGKPDVLLTDGESISSYGLDAVVLNTPGHSSGSICILTHAGDLFCGDLFTNSTGKPRLNSMMYDHEAGLSSFERLKTMPIKIVYPGHGEPFPWDALLGA